MSGGGGGGGGGGTKVSIPSILQDTILNIKEITGNHTDEEVYAMLKDCAMDPNETTQKLLLQDTFHEVRRKRDKRKENIREQVDPRWRSGVLGRGGRSGRGGYSSRFLSNDAGGGRNITAGKENGVNQATDKGNVSSSSLPTPDMENKLSTSVSSSVSGAINGPTKADKPTSREHTVQVSGDEGSAGEIKGMRSSSLISADAKTGSASGKPSITLSSISGVYALASDPILVPSIDARVGGAVGAIKRQISSQRMVVDTTANKIPSRDVVGPASSSGKGSSEMVSACVHGKIQNKSQLYEVKQVLDTSQAVSSSTVSGSGGSRPSSNYSNRSQQLSGSHKVGSSKEWKPKSTHVNAAQPSGTLGTSDVTPITVEAVDRPLSASSSITSDFTTPKLEKKLEDLQISETHHVIIPHHFQVPESERHGFSFGSFDASFRLGTCLANVPAINDCSTPPSEISQEAEENVDEVSSSIRNESPAAQEEYSPDLPQTPAQIPESLPSREADVPSGIASTPEFDQLKPEESSASEGSQYSVVQTVPTYSTFGLVPQVLSSQFAPFESTEPQAREATRVPSFVVQQPFDPSTSYYTQIYRPSPSPDGDGRFSPFLAPGPAAKYNGNIAVLPAHTGLSPQESGNSVVLSSAGPTPLATQAGGVMQSSIPVTQQPVPIFRQPAGVHMSHFPPNYIPYNQYFSPFYVPPPTLHPFLGNVAFPQQPPTGSIYPPPAAAAGAPVKYPFSQYKPGTNTANSNHVGIPAYGAYNSSQVGYGPIPAAAGGNSTGADDLTGSQYKENNVYITGQQQSEGSTVWIPAAGRDISGLPVNSFYSLPQAQHMTFAPTQAGHGALGGIYHPTQTVAAAGIHPLLQQSQTMAGAVEVAGPPAGNYQQPQRGQMNWANNY